MSCAVLNSVYFRIKFLASCVMFTCRRDLSASDSDERKVLRTWAVKNYAPHTPVFAQVSSLCFARFQFEGYTHYS